VYFFFFNCNILPDEESKALYINLVLLFAVKLNIMFYNGLAAYFYYRSMSQQAI